MRLKSPAWKFFVVTMAVLSAFYVTIVKKGGGLGIHTAPQATAQTRRNPGGRRPADANYELSAMRALRFVLTEINTSYVDPQRIHPREMFLKGLEAIQRSVAQVLVRHEDNAPTVTLRVDTVERTFNVADINAPWILQDRWGEVMTFLQEQLRGHSDVNLQDVEYAAANGMLHTLDPHSVLLSPEAFHEMQIQTGGHFGGLGIVISLRDGLLTVMNPMPNTPASQAGLRRFDRIVQIENESTLNMTLTEAVNRLRGPENSRVNIRVVRNGPGGWTQPRPFTLTRAVINVDSVESRMLAGNVGYARVKNFSEDTTEELARALRNMHQQGMRSLVLDLRGNPGGLLERAVEISDLFLSRGTIVITASNNRHEGREERQAQEPNTEANYPIVVLIDGSSASASEIVAGALKNNNRAVIVGQTSFGKGSVQTIRQLPDGGALKITIAQYLTPGDVSIQGVGITPDIELQPQTVDVLDMDLEAERAFLREADLSAHLTSNRARDGGRASEVVQYYFPFAERESLRERGPDDLGEEGWREDFFIRFAREVLSANPRPERGALLQDARPIAERLRQAELAQVVRALGALPQQVDWSEGPNRGETTLDVHAELSRTEAVPGEPFTMTMTVTNRGANPVYRLRANTRSDNPLFDHRELVFGRIGPGETRSWTAPLGLCLVEGYRPGSSTPPPPGAPRVCNIPRASLSRIDGLRFEWSERYGHVPTNVAPLRTQVRGLDRPVYAYGWQVADNVRGNGDGRLQRGEEVTLYFNLRNIGRGRGFQAQANLKNLSGQGVLLHGGRFRVDNLQPNGESLVAFTFEVQPTFGQSEVRLELQVEDEDLHEYITQKIVVPIAEPAEAPRSASGAWTATQEAPVFENPSTDAHEVGRVPAGVGLTVSAQSGDYLRVEIARGRPGWVRRVDGATRAGRTGAVALSFQNYPPLIETDALSRLAVRGNTARITGRVQDETRVLDLYVFVGSRKVFYQSNRNGQNQRDVNFAADLPLRPGSNIVTVVARENEDVVARRTYVIRRDGPNGELLSTPRNGSDRDEDE